ncbi:M23 family metallopeptidase [Paenibacillus sp. ACRRX]|uniref:M23 family metallopeptidase n=1 Tax=Paenibacillus sp. ACRRX TaxID=2918206 RepID=UPI001EF5EEE5|nr:M23 family metallopeptidase [Paenibacillus sp. ACRRX]MCG7410209.1 M23 family metallopeptidase [Paenibacillus sp. ACRRX]
MKADIRKRRQERIRQLTLGDVERAEGVRDRSQAAPLTIKQKQSVEPLPSAHRPMMDGMPNIPGDDIEDPEEAWRASRQQWGERYGWYESTAPPVRGRFVRSVRLQLAGAVLLCVCVAAILRISTPWTDSASVWVKSALTQDMNMAPIAAWYEATFGGSPAFIPIWNNQAEQAQEMQSRHQLGRPLEGTVVQPFALNLKGIELASKTSDTSVHAAATGKVMDITRDPEAGTTVLVQHTDGYSSIYGQLETSHVNVDDWLESGEVIGSIEKSTSLDRPATLFFAIKKNGQYVDPADVIDID